MGGIFPADTIIKRSIELGLEDLSKNEWLIDDIFQDLVRNPYLNKQYGQAQVDAAKEWFRNNKIQFFMALRKDHNEFPCVTIELGNSNEKPEMKTMGDLSTESVILLPNQINKPIPYIVKPFTPTGYNPATGEVSVGDDFTDLYKIAPNMLLVDPDRGEGFPILDITDDSIVIEAGLYINADQFAVIPSKPFYKARVEHTFFQETYNIGCHAHGDAQNLIFLHSIVLYSLLRYRESLFEANGFAETVFSNGPLSSDSYMDGMESIWSRNISITGQVENTWIKSPKRFIENIQLKEKGECETYTSGIKIISNYNTPDFIDQDNESWTTIEEE